MLVDWTFRTALGGADAARLRREVSGERTGFERIGQNMIHCRALQSNRRNTTRRLPREALPHEKGKRTMEGNLILTGWGYSEYVAAAAVALKARRVKATWHPTEEPNGPAARQAVRAGRAAGNVRAHRRRGRQGTPSLRAQGRLSPRPRTRRTARAGFQG